MRIVGATGNVGIGTSSPATKLDVAATEATIRVTSTTGTNLTDVRVVNTGGTLYSGIERSSGGALGPTGAYEAFFLYGADRPMYIGTGNSYLRFGTNATERMRLDSSGNLGIGTSSPTTKLYVTVSAASTACAAFFNTDTANGNGVYIKAGGANSGKYALAIDNAASSSLLLLDNAGNLGLGVTPSAWYSSFKVFETTGGSFIGSGGGAIVASNTYLNTSASFIYKANGYATYYDGNVSATGAQAWYNAPTGTAGNAITFTQAMTLDASGNLGIGATSSLSPLTIERSGGTSSEIKLNQTGGSGRDFRIASTGSGYGSVGNLIFYDATASAERVRIDSSGNLLFAKTTASVPDVGILMLTNGRLLVTSLDQDCLVLNRQSTDGVLAEFRHANTTEGDISISGTTVSYNGGHLSRYAQTTTAKDESLLKGTVLSNLDEMNVYTKDGQPVANEQLNKVKMSNVEGDANVAGVFVNWSHDEVHNVDEINMAMTGDMIIRIAQGTTVQRGDLLMSAGDGTAKPQGDDIVRSKTIAKVTSNHVTCTYADGSYCVPCVLMAC